MSPSDEVSEPDGQPLDRADVRLHAEVSGHGQVNMAARDIHVHHQDGSRGTRRVESGTVVEECPYPGLAVFTAEQAPWFFGRDDATAALIDRLAERLRGGGPLVVVAPSGTGKSSLLRAGMLPALDRGALPVVGSRCWPQVVFTPTAHPMTAASCHLATLLNVESGGETDAWAAHPDRLIEALRVRLAAHDAGAARVVVVVDQLEELFTLCTDERERRGFLDLMARLADAGAEGESVGLVVYGLRMDAYSSCANYPQLRAALQDGQIILGPLSETGVREAILFPLRAVGMDIEPGLVELLLRDLGITTDDDGGYEAGRLPLLAHALRATWQQRHGSIMTVEGYRATGGIHHAVAATAERVFTRLDVPVQQVARALFLRLVKIGDDADDTRRTVTRDDLLRDSSEPGNVSAVLDAFTRSRLLALEQDTVEITHEALLRAWPRLRSWIDTDRAGNLVRQELEEAASAWDHDQRDLAVLYRGSRLETIRNWINTTAHVRDLSPVANAFFAASTRQETRVKRLRRNVIVALSALALLTTAAAIFAFQQSVTARAQRDDAVLRQVSADATRLRGTDPSLAAKLDLIVYRMRQIPDIYTRDPDVYLGLVAGTYTPLTTVGSNHVESMTYSPDGRIIAVASASDYNPEINGTIRTIRLWNVTDSAYPTLSGQLATTGYVKSMAFSPDGRTLASGNSNAKGDGTIRLWNVTDPSHPAVLGLPLTGAANCPDNINGAYNYCAIFSMAYSPDGRTLASGNGEGTVWLWNVTDPAHPTPLPQLTGHTSNINSVEFSPDSRTLASGGDDQTIRLWNVTDPTHPAPLVRLTTSGGYVTSVAFSPNGRTLASSGNSGAIWLWNVTNPAHPTLLHQLTGHAKSASSVAFSPDLRILASAGLDAIRLWNVTDPTHPAALGELTVQSDVIGPVVFSPNGRTLVSAGNTVRLWEMSLDQAIRKICATSGNLTRQQWQQHIPDLPYNPPCT